MPHRTNNATNSPETPPGVGISELLADGQICADDARVACPLFQAEYGGSKPTSALHLKIGKIDVRKGRKLNRLWHSRLPEIVNWQGCEAYAAEHSNIYYAVALWGQPVARMLNGRGWYELRRMAIADDAPDNTASRMLRIMRLLIAKDRPEVVKLISYQDTEAHTGTIYKWLGIRSKKAKLWTDKKR